MFPLPNRAAQRAKRAPNMAKGVPNKILKGKDQLSYCADRIRKTNISEKVRITPKEPEAFFS
jgi:hypothetical protein